MDSAGDPPTHRSRSCSGIPRGAALLQTSQQEPLSRTECRGEMANQGTRDGGAGDGEWQLYQW